MRTRSNRRVLIIDDNPAIHDDFRKVLRVGAVDIDCELSAKETVLFGEPQSPQFGDHFEVDTALQGQDGVEMILAARRESRPYALAFVDIRMPPGIDGVETIERVMELDADIQFVICSAYSDYSAQEILLRLGVSDRLLLLRKPCDAAEILLMSCAMCEKWSLTQFAKVI